MDTRTKAWWIIFASGGFLGLLVVGKALISPKPTCDPSIQAKTVIVLDHSEAVPAQTAEAIVERTWEFIEKNVREGELVSVFTLSQLSKKNLKATFSACKPRKTGNRSIESEKKVAKEFQEKFQKPLRNELAKPIASSDESPIAQALIDLSLDDKHFRSTDVTRLLIYSDMLENTPNFSFYKQLASKDCKSFIQRFRDTRAGSVALPIFHNADVYINYIPRHNLSAQVFECRTLFWNWFFSNNQCKVNPNGKMESVCLTPDNLPG